MQKETQELFTQFVKSIKLKDIAGKELYEQYASYKSAIKTLSEYG